MMKLFLLVLALFSSSSYADYFTKTGSVDFVRTHNIGLNGEDSDWLALQGVSSAGNCRVAGGFVIFRFPDNMDRGYSTAISAQLAGKQLSVNVNDEMTDSTGACWIRWLNITN